MTAAKTKMIARPILEVEPEYNLTTSWLPKSVLSQSTPLITKAGLEDNLLVSGMGMRGGLLAVNKGPSPAVRVLDRYCSAGLSIGCRTLARALYGPYMVLFIHEAERVLTIANARCLAVHDIRLEYGQIILVSTGTNEVVQVDLTGEIRRSWKFPGEGDTRHINCLDMWNGRYVVSCFGRFENFRGWKDNSKGAGLVIDLETDETIWDGLTQPHTPRMDSDGRQYICDSGARRILRRQPDGSDLCEVRFADAWPRGMAFGEKHIYVGLSQIRKPPAEGEKEKKAPQEILPNAHIAVLDRATFQLLDEFEVPCSEVYEIVVPRADDSDSLAAFQNAI